jgi:hypothetical protein
MASLIAGILCGYLVASWMLKLPGARASILPHMVSLLAGWLVMLMFVSIYFSPENLGQMSQLAQYFCGHTIGSVLVW